MDELRVAVRRLARQPGPLVASVITLACGIGAAAGAWSLLSAVLLHPISVTDPARLVVVGQRITAGRQAGSLRDSHNYPFYHLIRDSAAFERTVAGGPWSLSVSAGAFSGVDTVYFATHDFFDVLGVPIPLGRSFTAEEDRRGAPPVAILSNRFWRRAYAADPTVVGREMTVNGRAVTIVGVAGRAFRGIELARPPAIYVPLDAAGDLGSAAVNSRAH